MCFQALSCIKFFQTSIKPEYAHLCSALTNISKMLEFNSLSTNQYSDILENFANSNV